MTPVSPYTHNPMKKHPVYRHIVIATGLLLGLNAQAAGPSSWRVLERADDYEVLIRLDTVNVSDGHTVYVETVSNFPQARKYDGLRQYRSVRVGRTISCGSGLFKTEFVHFHADYYARGQRIASEKIDSDRRHVVHHSIIDQLTSIVCSEKTIRQPRSFDNGGKLRQFL